MERVPQFENKKFNNIEDELKYLRREVQKREQQLVKQFENPNKESVIRQEIRSYDKLVHQDVLEKPYAMMEHVAKEIALELSPEEHDKKMEELLGLLYEKGIKNTLLILSHLKNHHLEDDFHRFLVQLIKSGIPITNTPEKVKEDLHQTLFEVVINENDSEEDKSLTEKIFLMQKLFEGLISSFETERKKDSHFSIELANSEGHKDISFYFSIPDTKKSILEKQILAVFPKAKIFEKKDDYNIFNYKGFASGAYAKLSVNSIYPLKMYDEFQSDPVQTIINACTSLEKHGEGVSIQLVVSPDYGEYLVSYKEALRRIQQGEKIEDAINIHHSVLGSFSGVAKGLVKDIFKELVFGQRTKENSQQNNQTFLVDQIKKKIDSLITHTTIRVIASGQHKERSKEILNDVLSSFGQFTNSLGNKIIWNFVSEKDMYLFAKDFSYRRFSKQNNIPLSIKELATICHFPVDATQNPSLKTSRFETAPPPLEISKDGVLLGVNHDRNTTTHIFMSPEDRLRHMYVIGQTGTGKTTLLKNMIIQDIKNGEGVCFIDPHGSDIEDILANIPKERIDDVIYFDPSDTKRIMGLNMLEFDPRFPEQKTFVVNELLSIFNKLFDMKVAGGPMFEQYFRNSVQLVMDDPKTGNTLLEVMRVLSSKDFRNLKLSKCKNPLVIQFWREIAEKAGGESSLQNMVPYITNKFDVFLSNDIMRPVVLQEKSSFNLREIMDTKKIFLVNLSKGRLGDINSNLIGLIIVGKILMAALSRVDSFGKTINPFYVYIDEFQNITTNSISQIFSEARKYKLSLTVAHQFIGQLDDSIKDSVFGNVGTVASFRVGAEDGEFLEKQFSNFFKAKDFVNIDNRNFYLKLLANGKPLRPFSVETLPPQKGDDNLCRIIKELSALKYAREKVLVEEEIISKYREKSSI